MDTPPFEFARSDVPLAELTLYRVGGPARWALFPRNLEETRQAWAWMLKKDVRRLVLGGGSNMLIADEGYDGAVLVTTSLCWVHRVGDGVYDVGTGTPLARLVREVLVPNNYAGVGGLTGIPGSVGGAVYMNAGTVNGSICQLMDYVRLARESGEAIVDVTPERYAYRRQALCGPGDLILEGRFRFERSVDDQRGVYEHYMKRRREKQPQGRCCGSVFKNPPGDHAGRLIEACGLKGERRGGARVSPMHANFIMNEAGASCADILALIALCKKRVRERFGVELEEEVRVIG